MWEKFRLRGNYKWIEILPDLIQKFNGRIHRTIVMRPQDVDAGYEDKILQKLNIERRR